MNDAMRTRRSGRAARGAGAAAAASVVTVAMLAGCFGAGGGQPQEAAAPGEEAREEGGGAPAVAPESPEAYDALVAPAVAQLRASADNLSEAVEAVQRGQMRVEEAVAMARAERETLRGEHARLQAVEPPPARDEAHRHLLAAYDEALAGIDAAISCLTQYNVLACAGARASVEESRRELRRFEETASSPS